MTPTNASASMPSPIDQRPQAVSGRRSDVRALYEAFPYPSPSAGDSLIEDVATGLRLLYGDDPLEGRRILDAGCGTGHRLLAVAREYPRAECVGVDMASASLMTAQRLAATHDLRNVRFERSNLEDLRFDHRFDIIVSTGVIHHFENPLQGLRSLGALLADDGLMSVWLYHAIGEHQRLLDRELLLTMWDRASGFERGVRTMTELGLRLEATRYGLTAAQRSPGSGSPSLDADAYMHPIVHAYRFGEAIDLFRGCGDLDWVAINSISTPSGNKLLDLTESESSETRMFCQPVDELFEMESLRATFRRLGPFDKLRAVELKLRPNGFAVIAGRGESYHRFGARVAGNVIITADPVRS